MRKTKTVKLDDREIIIKEMTVKDIYNLFEEDVSLLDKVDHFLSRCSDITRQDLMEYAPSELDVLVDTFTEVNASFLARSKSLGLNKIVNQVVNEIVSDLQNPFAQLSEQDTDQ